MSLQQHEVQLQPSLSYDNDLELDVCKSQVHPNKSTQTWTLARSKVNVFGALIRLISKGTYRLL